MAEYIEREAAYQTLTEYYHHTTEGMHSALREAISRVPAADVRPVVLCRDCYAYKKDPELARAAYLDPEEYCAILRVEMPEDGYCWYGCPYCGADMREET